MYQNTAIACKSQQKSARVRKLMVALEKDNQDPRFRAAAKEFVKIHT